MTPELAAAIEVFRELGWQEAEPADVLQLPIGTAQQRRIAKKGLSKGEWGGYRQLDASSYGYVSDIDVDEEMLGAFAVRVGVPVRRAVWAMPGPRFSPSLRGELIVERGAEFAATWLNARGRAASHTPALVYAITKLGLEVPTNLEYLERWAACVDASLRQDERRVDRIDLVIIGQRFADHLKMALESHLPAPAGAALLLHEGIERGWIAREEAQEHVLFAMEQAQRPGDRKAWATVLIETLQVSDQWLLGRSGVVVSTMSFGDDAIINRFAPILLSSGDDDLIMQAMLIGLTAKSSKAKAQLLAAASSIPPPSQEVCQVVAETLAQVGQATDRRVRKATDSLASAWQFELRPEEPIATTEVLGLWCATPQTSPVPELDLPAPTSANLTRLVSALVVERHDGLTLDGERFIATANALAHVDLEATRSALRGAKKVWRTGLIGAAEWLAAEDSPYLDAASKRNSLQVFKHQGPVIARSAGVFQRLGRVPVLLSTPTWLDWRIDPADLADRLLKYVQAEEPVIEADLQLALPRIDLELVTPEVRQKLLACPSPIILQDGKLANSNVGRVLHQWLDQPLDHPGFEDDSSTLPKPIQLVPALAELPPRLSDPYLWAPTHVFANWLDARIPQCDGACATLRGRPNGALASAQLLNHVGPDAMDATLAATAWRNGVLLPGVAEVSRLAWGGQIPSLAARVAGWTELAEDGLLSVVWPFAADAVSHSSTGSRVQPGVADVVRFLARFLPEVEAAIEHGLTTDAALTLPGVRHLAKRNGSSLAVQAARELVALLPTPTAPIEPEKATARLNERDFAKAWPEVPDPPVLEDGAQIEFEEVVEARGQTVKLTVQLPDQSVHETAPMTWIFPIAHEQLLGLADWRSSDRWLGYDSQSGQLRIWPGRNNPDRGKADSVFSMTLVTALFLSQLPKIEVSTYDFHAVCGPSGLGHDRIGPTRVAAVMDRLLNDPRVDPHRFVRALSRNPSSLPVLYPVLTRAILHASKLDGKPPRWLVRIIDVATTFAPVLREATIRGCLSPDEATWPGLAKIAATSKSPAAKRKAAQLLEALRLP